MNKKGYYHSVTLDETLCRGCTNCISDCPTEAIRVRDGKAYIIRDRCIDCGECIRSCPAHAKKALSDPFEIIDKYDYKVALPAPSLYGQFREIEAPEFVLSALLEIGFDDVYEVAKAAEIVTVATRKLIEAGSYPKPLISSSCPAVVRLIQLRFPSLIENIIKIQSPMEVAARVVKKYIHKDKKNIGVFFISPCPAKVTAVRAPIGHEDSFVDGVISVNTIYSKLRAAIKKITTPIRYSNVSGAGIGWAQSDGESDAVDAPKSISVDGILQVIKVLEQIENEDIHDVDFIEVMACPGGCVGGTFNVENTFIARSAVKRIIKNNKTVVRDDEIFRNPCFDLSWTKEIYSESVMKLDKDINVAMQKMEQLDIIHKELPGLDCGSCGAPTCRALAEDIVRHTSGKEIFGGLGFAEKSDCIFIFRDEIRELARRMWDLEKKMPVVYKPHSETENLAEP
ncbi:MAG: 4Fe-4S dicluster domain-containing protein [Spirochaetes bacterium]|nr:4Fe-4S dicluster domain-containing protein [Spirochaetota bacterium]